MSTTSPLFFFSGGVAGLLKPWLCASAIRLITCGRHGPSVPPLVATSACETEVSTHSRRWCDNRQANKTRFQEQRSARHFYPQAQGGLSDLGLGSRAFGCCYGAAGELSTPARRKLTLQRKHGLKLVVSQLGPTQPALQEPPSPSTLVRETGDGQAQLYKRHRNCPHPPRRHPRQRGGRRFV